ncbi:Secretin OutD (General secretion pathway protein D) (Pectic enzymes secretion protein OutD) (Type II secretion system protein D) (T2SS protein D) [Durusdinium trenchii]|uniref:Secretin OutD (General secretion pathway protein D) (Pectic enzymes secretion protein OutD) (Type II secretion system protein D) (T2SS protein D) n=1 Tax=Durusdinium trenchii TaxID=1381693 RepID=A0ABP0LED4_9DINO
MTLLELMAATTIMATLMASVVVLVRSSYSVWQAHETDMEAAETAYSTLRHFVRSARQATAVSALSPAADTSGNLSLVMESGDIWLWQHTGAGGQVLFGVAPSSADQLLADNIDQMTFVGYEADGTTPTTTVGDIRSIKCTVQVTMPADYERALYLANAGIHHACAELEANSSWRGTVSDGLYPANDTYQATASDGSGSNVDIVSIGVAGDVTRTLEARTVVVHVTPSELRALVLVHRTGEQQPLAICRRVPWRIDAESLYTLQGEAELGAAIVKLAAEERLAGSQAEVLLGSELCVTRAVSGGVDHVQREIATLRERSQLYLSLGPGRKVSATSTTPLDARHSHAMLTVATEQTLRALSQAFEAAGIEIVAIRSAQVALAHTVHHMEGDETSAALTIGVESGSVELGIMKAGRLFLDYRPGGDVSVEQVTHLLAQHHTRLQRYCQRHQALDGDDLTRIVVSGEQHALERVLADLSKLKRLQVSLVDPASAALPWELKGEDLSPEMAATVGCALALEHEDARQAPNLIDELISTARPPIMPVLWRRLAPMAAAVLVAAVFGILSWTSGREVAEMKEHLALLAPKAARAAVVRSELLAMQVKTNELENLTNRIESRPYSLLLGNLAQSLPAEVWLSDVHFQGGEAASIAGISYAESSIYDFVGHLQHLPGVASVALQGTGIGRAAHRNAALLLPGFEKRYTERSEALAEQLAKTLTEENEAEYRNGLVKLVRDSGCQLRRLNVSPAIVREWGQDDNPLEKAYDKKLKPTGYQLERRQVSLTLSGPTDSVRRLIERFEKHDKQVHLQTLNLKPDGGNGRRVELTMEMWLAPKAARRELLRSGVRMLLWCLALVAPSASWAQTGPQIDLSSATMRAPSPELLAALERRGDLVLRGSTLDAALFTINELWNVNIIAGEVEGQVNGVFKDAPLKEILDTILLGNGYGYRMVGESIVVSRLEQLGRINPFFVSEAIQVMNARPSELVEAARLLSTPQGQVQPIDSARSLIVIDFPERVKMIRDLVASVDAASGGPGMLDATGRPKPLEVGYFHTQYITVADAKKVLATVLSAVGRVEAVDGEDRLVVVDFAENLQVIERVLANLDRPRPQVQITALIYDLSLTDIEQIGINWAQAINTRTAGTLPTNTQLQISNPFTPSASGALFTFQHFGDTFDLSAVAEAIQSASDSRLLANPNVTVMDNEEASFEAVTQIPYQQITQTQQGGQLAGTAFKDAGIKLDVVPKVSADGTVELIVRPEFSRLTGFTPGDNQPIIDTRATSTAVRVRSGETLVIGGMRQRSDVGDFGAVPGLKDVRWLGHLFRSRSTDIRESELVVFITPRIIGYSDPLDCRSQLVKDTVDCRLNHIPRAEGCPPMQGGGCMDCGVAPGMPVESPGYSPTPAPEMIPPPQARSTFVGAPPAKLCYRLPPTQPELQRLPLPTDGQSQVMHSSPAPTAPRVAMRPDYEARFRAAGNASPGVQRPAPSMPTPSDEKDTQGESWWKRMWKR